MYVVLEVLFLLSVTAAIGIWLRGEGCERYGRKKQLVALIVALILFYPCISLADDFLVQQQPLEMPDTAPSLSKCGTKTSPATPHAPPAAVPAAPAVAMQPDGGVAERLAWTAARSAIDSRAGAAHGLRAPPQR